MGKKRKRVDKTDASNEPPLKKQNPAVPELPPGVHHYQSIDEVPWDIQKYEHECSQRRVPLMNDRYWNQGYSIFSKYDDGIWMTDDSWYEVTHESVAKYVVVDFLGSAWPSDSSKHNRPACRGRCAAREAHYIRCHVRSWWKHHCFCAFRKMEASICDRERRSDPQMRAA